MEKEIQKIQTEVRSLPLTEGENETGIPYTTAWYYKNEPGTRLLNDAN